MFSFLGFAAVGAALNLNADFALVVGVKHRNLEAFEEFFWDVSNPRSPNYAKYLTVPEIADFIGASQSTLDQVSNWLLDLGARPESCKTSDLRDTITCSFESTPTTFSSNGIPTTPAQMDDVVDFILRQDYIADTAETRRLPTRATHPAAVADPVDNGEGDPQKQKDAYGLPRGTKAKNANTTQMVWGPGTFGYFGYDLELFQTYYEPDLNLKKITCNGKEDCDNNGDNFGEGTLDTSYISAMGLSATTLVSNTNTSSSTEEGKGFGAALLWFVNDLASHTKNVPQVLSMSLGSLSAFSCDLLCSEAAKVGISNLECNAFLQKQRQVCMFLSQDQVDRINVGLQVLGTRGISVFASSGDGGSHFSFGQFSGGLIADALNTISCTFQMPVFPTSSPYLTSVGGTGWSDAGGSPAHPVAWDGSGGGFSWQFSAPSHQKAVVANYLSTTSGLPPASSFNSSGRAYPDVAALADVVIPLCVYGGCSPSGGTSASSPTVAGLFTLLNDHRMSNGLPPLGFVSPRIWQVATEKPGAAFQDITKGNTKTTCDNGFPAGPGWDPTTGWGRPVWAGMLEYFGSAP
jgi:tripeptidyl-peptidase-1